MHFCDRPGALLRRCTLIPPSTAAAFLAARLFADPDSADHHVAPAVGAALAFHVAVASVAAAPVPVTAVFLDRTIAVAPAVAVIAGGASGVVAADAARAGDHAIAPRSGARTGSG